MIDWEGMPDIYVAKEHDGGAEEKKTEETPALEALKKERTANPLATFSPSPAGVRFETQDREEEIVLILRMHWVTNIPWIVLAIVLIVAPLILRSFPLIDFLPVRYQLMSILMWYLLVTAYIFEQFLTWVFNAYIITDERIVDIDFYNLLYKEVSDAKIDKIQDVTLKMGGVVRAILDFGDVYIQTAGTQPNFEFRAVPKPSRVVRILQELRTQEEIEALEGRAR